MNNPCDFEVVSAKLSVECFATGNAEEILFKVRDKKLFEVIKKEVASQQGLPNIGKGWLVKIEVEIANLFNEQDRLTSWHCFIFYDLRLYVPSSWF